MKVPFVDLHAQYLSTKPQIDEAIHSVISETAFIGGKYVKKFEEEFSSAYGTKHCVSVANGTDAIYIVLKMLGVGAGDEVITVANSWISTSETIGQTGAKPVFVDIDPDYYSINENLIESKITSKTRAIIPVHLHGQAANIKAIKAIADKHHLPLIEDCAQSHFSAFEGKNVGTFGLASTFSFYPGKNLGAYGDAGCILTNDDSLAEKVRMYANHGGLQKNNHRIEGINSRLDGLQAAILSAKLPHLLKWNESRIRHAAYYSDILKDVEGIVLPNVRPNSKHTFHLYVIRSSRRNDLQKFLKENGIDTAIHYPLALPFLPAYNYLNHTQSEFPVAAKFQNEILSLPMSPELSREMMDYVAQKINEFSMVASRA